MMLDKNVVEELAQSFPICWNIVLQGQECRQITEELIKALGDVIQTENTAEYFEEKVVNVNKVRKNENSRMP